MKILFVVNKLNLFLFFNPEVDSHTPVDPWTFSREQGEGFSAPQCFSLKPGSPWPGHNHVGHTGHLVLQDKLSSPLGSLSVPGCPGPALQQPLQASPAPSGWIWAGSARVCVRRRSLCAATRPLYASYLPNAAEASGSEFAGIPFQLCTILSKCLINAS